MNSIWTRKWKTVFLWMSAYLSFIAYALVGGYVILKEEDDELKLAAKHALIVTVIFSALSAFLSLFNYIGGLTSNYYTSTAYEFYSTCSSLVGIAKIAVFAVFVVMAFLKKESPAAQSDDTAPDAE